MTDPSDSNAPLRGPTFAVVAPALGVVVVLAVLALRSCTASPPEGAPVPEHGSYESPATVVLALGSSQARTRGSGAALR